MAKVATFRHTDCLAILKWKQGERKALTTFRRGANSNLHILFEMPPAGDFDHEKQRPLTPAEHIKMFGPRLREACGRRVAFVDALHVDDELHREGLTQHPLTELLERARLAGALACPTVSPSHSVEYRRAVRRFSVRNTDYPICIRLDSTHLDSPTHQANLRELLGEMNCEPSRCFLVLDFKALETSSNNVDQFVELLADLIADVPFIHNWLGLAVALSSFPATIRLKPSDVKEYPRNDLAIYESLISNPKGLLRTPMFGDYAVDTSPIQKPVRRTPSAHLRYSTKEGYAVAKGTTVKKPYGYEAIYPVADALVTTSCFSGPTYSAGDAFIFDLHQRATGTGNAATWRWASTDHHLTLNIDAIGDLYGLAGERRQLPIDAPSIQGELFDENSPASDDDRSSDPASIGGKAR